MSLPLVDSQGSLVSFLPRRESLDCQPEHRHDAVHRLVLPPHRAAAVSAVIPVAGARCVKTSSIFLHDDAGHDVLEGLLQLGQAGEAGLHHAVGPLVHLGVLKTNH